MEDRWWCEEHQKAFTESEVHGGAPWHDKCRRPLVRITGSFIAAIKREAIEQEREFCAQVCDQESEDVLDVECRDEAARCAILIRARSEEET